MSTIAFLGTGNMGLPMARNLAEAGFRIRAWNRTAERAQPLREQGATVCVTAPETAREAAVMITMLSGPDAVLQVAPGALRALSQGGLWIQMSTIGPDASDRCAELAAQAGVTFVDAPVLGTREPAEAGELVVLASGAVDALDSCEPIFDAIGSRTVRAGSAGSGSRLKLVVNSWMLGLTAALAESIDVAEALELDPKLLLAAIADGPVDTPYAHIKSEKMISGDYSDASFRLELAHKDAVLAVAAAQHHGLAADLLEAVQDRLARASAAGHGDDDMAAIRLGSRAADDGPDLTASTHDVKGRQTMPDPQMSDAERRREEQRPLDEAGEGESEGFELAEKELMEHASHGDLHSAGHIFSDMPSPEAEESDEGAEADHELTSEQRD
jgi:3-hydroxyisobutyrate dehydrogenase